MLPRRSPAVRNALRCRLRLLVVVSAAEPIVLVDDICCRGLLVVGASPATILHISGLRCLLVIGATAIAAILDVCGGSCLTESLLYSIVVYQYGWSSQSATSRTGLESVNNVVEKAHCVEMLSKRMEERM